MALLLRPIEVAPNLDGERVPQRLLAEALPYMAWLASADGTPLYFNTLWRDYSGSSSGDATFGPWQRTLHPLDAPCLLARWQQALLQQEPLVHHVRLKRRDGAFRWHQASVVPIPDAEGVHAGWLCTCQDMEEEKRRDERDGFLRGVSDLATESQDVETTLTRLARLTVPILADLCAVDLLSPEGRVYPLTVIDRDPKRSREATAHRRAHAADPGVRVSLEHVLRSGRRVHLRSLSPELLGAASAGQGLLGTMGPDGGSVLILPLHSRARVVGAVTLVQLEPGRSFGDAEMFLADEWARRASAFLENATLYREAQEAVRLRDEFLSVASHELKTPLTPLVLRLERLDRDWETLAAGRAAAREQVQLALGQAHKVAGIIEGLLEVSHVTLGRLNLELSPVDLVPVVEEVMSGFSTQAKRMGCVLSHQLPKHLWGRWDRSRLEQVVTHLLSNAVKYGAGRPVRVELEEQDRQACLSVIDHGIGMAPQDRTRVFERFGRAVSERHYGGLGLGLFLTQQIVEALGGRVDVASELGRGSTFMVRLPAAGP
jgi:PAS domain S-box-containing protein